MFLWLGQQHHALTRVRFRIMAEWKSEPDAFVTIRRSDAVNDGRPTTHVRRIDSNDMLEIKQARTQLFLSSS